jgi:pyruvate,orthophosphate dikinase
MATYIHPFGRDDLPVPGSAVGFGDEVADLLGGKGAGLAEMTRLGLPVPPGFIISTRASRKFLADGVVPAGLDHEIDEQVALVEGALHRRYGDPANPLLVSVRSGAPVSMPGMMDTVLNVGLTEAALPGLARRSGGERFALDCYRRLIQMFGTTVLGVPGEQFDDAWAAAKARAGATEDLALGTDDLRQVVDTYREICTRSGRPFPDDPHEQLRQAVVAVVCSWNSERAVVYRRVHRIADDLGTAVIVQAMVYGNRGPTSGSGVCFTRDPASGENRSYGEYLPNAQGEDVVAGSRTPVALSKLAELDPVSYDGLLGAMRTLEQHYRDMCDIEFTIEDGKLWVLQTRIGKRSPEAAFRIAHDLVGARVIDLDTALTRVTGDQLMQLMLPHFDISAGQVPLATGIAASPGAAVGRVVFDRATAVDWADRGERVILVRRETNAEDLAGMVASRSAFSQAGVARRLMLRWSPAGWGAPVSVGWSR